jgi:hypothetical protein
MKTRRHDKGRVFVRALAIMLVVFGLTGPAIQRAAAQDEVTIAIVRGDRTRVSLFVGENLSQTSTVPADDPSAPPEPPIEDTLGPIRSTAETATYTSPNFGYSITYDSALWELLSDATEPSDIGPIDGLVLAAEDGVIRADFYGRYADPSLTASQFVDRFAANAIANWGFIEAALRTDATGTPIRGGNESRAFVIIDFTYADESGDEQENTIYLEGWKLPTGDGFLIMLFQTPRSVYDDWVPAREALERGVTLPS